jgi:hypothetical protein
MKYKNEQMIHFRFPVSGTTGSSGMRSGTTTESSTDGKCLCTPHKKQKANVIVKILADLSSFLPNEIFATHQPANSAQIKKYAAYRVY